MANIFPTGLKLETINCESRLYTKNIDLMSQDVGSLHPQVLTRFLSTSMLNGRVTSFFFFLMTFSAIRLEAGHPSVHFFFGFTCLHWLKGLCGSDPILRLSENKIAIPKSIPIGSMYAG